MSASDRSTIGAWLGDADRSSDWSGVDAVVLGLGVSGFAVADALLRVGANVVVVDGSLDSSVAERAQVLDALGARIERGPAAAPPSATDLLIPSPGLPPTHPWVTATSAAQVWSGEQLAWQLRPLVDPAPWLVVTGTNGKTTTVEMLAAILRADGRRAEAVGNVGRPLLDAVFAEPAYDVLAVELSSFQLHWTPRLHVHASTLLNVADDHTDWHGSHDNYVKDKAKVFDGVTNAIIYNADDQVTEDLARRAEVVDGCRGIGFTGSIPDVGMLGVVDGILVDRAFVPDRQTAATELVPVGELTVTGQHNVSNALAAAALARSVDVSPRNVRDGLRGFRQGDHRLQPVGEVGGVTYIDDSKATNVHAADVALAGVDRVVWIAGGLAKGGRFDDLVRRHRHRLVAAVLLGADRGLIRDSILRHAPEVPIFEVEDGETDPMDSAVLLAARIAEPGDRVLLAPACASMDQFQDYAARGVAFRAAVDHLGP